MEIRTDNYFSKQVHIRGNGLEERVESYLLSMHIPFQRNKNNGIDFIINGYTHLDCVAQGQSGSIGDKLPHKAFKYLRKYNLKDIYILHPYSPITKTVGDHLIFLEEQFNANIHILDWADFVYLMNGGTFDIRKPYNYVSDSARVKNTPPNNITLNRFFEYKK
jgi:hypothetical protein